jgi:anti-sigma factor ChrR (cupin superfamily)
VRIHADLTKKAVVDSHALDWIPSPLPGVHRKMLDRVGDEVARATSIVKYEPGSYFDEHTHIGGEEFLVLDGVFSDEMGDFPQGMYVRNPIGSAHRPHTESGCVILVKLMQFDPDDQAFVRIDTNTESWQPGPIDGITVKILHEYKSERVALFCLEPGASAPFHSHEGGEEIYVLTGSYSDEGGNYPQGTWVRYPQGSEHAPYSESGCTLFIKTGHLNA